MTTSNQRLHEISVIRLKSLSDLVSLSLDTTPLVAITGANGCGKSTILHALACVYRPQVAAGTNYKFPRFFLPTTDSRWEGSSFQVTHSYRVASTQFDRIVSAYGKAQDRWTPRYETRPERHVDFIGIETCVPHIESERATSYLELTSTPRNDAVANAVRQSASKVLNRNYTAMSKRSGGRRTYRGVQFGGVTYSSLSMGAGEQRVFDILERVYLAPKHSLILIDEVDLLLHEDALSRLITVLHERAESKSLQVIFTTHRESVLHRNDITVHHIFGADGRTLTMPATHPDVWHRLTGKSVRSLEVFVEDDIAQALAGKVAAELGLRKHLNILPVGAATNLFTLACGLALRGESLESKLFLLDGDLYKEPDEKVDQIKRVLTGHGAQVEQMRLSVGGAMKQFALAAGYWPERKVHELLTAADQDENEEVVRVARDLGVPMERHGFVNDVLGRLGDSREVGVHRVVEVASRSQGWIEFTAEFRAWLVGQRDALAL